ncbi:septation protein SepH [Umezawaea endophytica]|uniref:Septation protein SepH n=1 Tax=Umezawaea endophytica TaxID=1654476 RepID=A0A9X2VLL4_9PSEU|nr:septation protein SepH [Umezawaea endophytica]MCS7478953.1 septation protein SepH [Umezawaea endophytica]
MRALRVIGLDEDGKSVICEDPSGGERFLLPADERLRAAARGDLTRLGQIQIEVESQMRPREIQARIRAGESVEQVAAASGLPSHRVERYAYPVLLERSRTADLAQRAHPVREDGPDVQTLGEVVAHSFGLRGQDYTDVGWDSWRGEDGKWVVQMHWTAGRSDNIAHWAFHPGAHGGTVTALDEAAVDLMDPNPNRTLRTVRPVTQLARQALEAQTPVREEVETEILAKEEPAPAPVVPEQPVAEPEPVVEAPVAETPVAPPVRKEPPKRGKKTHPIVPSWEDVLLGVRSHRG